MFLCLRDDSYAFHDILFVSYAHVHDHRVLVCPDDCKVQPQMLIPSSYHVNVFPLMPAQSVLPSLAQAVVMLSQTETMFIVS